MRRMQARVHVLRHLHPRVALTVDFVVGAVIVAASFLVARAVVG
jgi:hypothetical protein